MGEKTGRQALILAGGEIKNYEGVKAEIRGAGCIICADSGFLHCERLGAAPDLLVGDFDSLPNPPKDIPAVTHPAAKDYTDSHLAVLEAAERGYTSLILAGMLGGRLDHALANIQTLVWCAQNGIKAYITDGEQRVRTAPEGIITLEPREGMYFSVLAVTSCAAVSISGAKYPLDAYPLSPGDPRAISNEYLDKPVTVTVTGGTALIVETGK